jgi:hypothetical protein
VRFGVQAIRKHLDHQRSLVCQRGLGMRLPYLLETSSWLGGCIRAGSRGIADKQIGSPELSRARRQSSREELTSVFCRRFLRVSRAMKTTTSGDRFRSLTAKAFWHQELLLRAGLPIGVSIISASSQQFATESDQLDSLDVRGRLTGVGSC